MALPSPSNNDLESASSKIEPTVSTDTKHSTTNSSAVSTPPTNAPTYPEGGLKAWSCVFGSFCAMVASFGIMSTIGTFQAHLANNQLKEYSEGQIGWIFSVYAFVSFFCGVQIGPVFDAYGPRWLVAAGSVCLVGGMVFLGVCKVYWHFMLVFGVMTGLGTSLIFTPAIASIGHWFFLRRAYATGLASTGGSIGGIMFPLIIQSATPRYGFAWACRILGAVFLVLLAVGNCLIRGRDEFLNAAGSAAEEEEEEEVVVVVAPSDKEKNTTFWTKFHPELHPTTQNKNKQKVKKKSKHTSSPFSAAKIDLSCFLDPRFTFTTLGIFLLEWGLFVPLAYLTTYSLHLGISQSLSYQLLSIFNAGSFFGRWLPGLVADRWGRFNAMILTVSLCLIAVLTVWLPGKFVEGVSGRVGATVVFAVVYGFASGSGISLTPVCVGQICETRDYGKRYGTCYFFVSFGTLTGIPIAGQILAKTGGDYTGLIVFTAAAYVCALAMFVAARCVGGGTGLRRVY